MANAVEIAREPGAPLPLNVQTEAAQRYGHSFSHVRIHADERASAAAASLHASAYTLGSDIVFGANRYQPRSQQGKLLLQHELRHVEQQRTAASVSAPALDSPHSIAETEARQLLDPHVATLAVQRIQCAPEDAQFSLGSGLADIVGKQVFGNSWPFVKAAFEGFIGGMQADVKSGRADKAKLHLAGLLVSWNAGKFYLGYLEGLMIGLVSPITDLVKGILGLVKLGASAIEWLGKWSVPGVALSPERQKKIADLTKKFGDLIVSFGQSLKELVSNPKESAKKFVGFLETLMQLAVGKAREMGASAAHSIFDFLDEEYFDMGRDVGKVLGTLIAQVLLVVFSGAIGNIVSKGASFLGKAAEFVAGKAVEIFEWVKSFAAEVLSILREAVKGALKVFEGLVNDAAKLFEAVAALFAETEEGAVAAAKAAGKGPLSGATNAELDSALNNMKAAGDPLQLQPHGSASSVRKALGQSGKEVQSAHGAPQSVMKRVPGYNPRNALTKLMEKAKHTGMDAYWKRTFRSMRVAGRQRVTAQEIFDVVAESIRRAPGLAAGEKSSLIARLTDEIFMESGLAPTDMLDLPYGP